MLDFYENCNEQRFEAAEPKYVKLLNTVGLGEPEYEKMKEAHDKRKLELQL